MRGLRRWGAAGLLAATLALGAVAFDGGDSDERVGTPVGDGPRIQPPEDRPGAPDGGGDGGALDGGMADAGTDGGSGGGGGPASADFERIIGGTPGVDVGHSPRWTRAASSP